MVKSIDYINYAITNNTSALKKHFDSFSNKRGILVDAIISAIMTESTKSLNYMLSNWNMIDPNKNFRGNGSLLLEAIKAGKHASIEILLKHPRVNPSVSNNEALRYISDNEDMDHMSYLKYKLLQRESVISEILLSERYDLLTDELKNTFLF